MRVVSVSSRGPLWCGLLLAGVTGCARSTTAQPETAPEAGQAPSGTVVTAEDIRQQPGQPIEQILASKCGSCVVTTTGGRVSIRIRGRSTLVGSDEPLYVIDGIPIGPSAAGPLSGINPYDIETIEVLTDPASISMYGSRGANGVLVITTKQPPPPRR